MKSFFHPAGPDGVGPDQRKALVPVAVILIPVLVLLTLASLDLWVFAPPTGLQITGSDGSNLVVDTSARIGLAEAATLTAAEGPTIGDGAGLNGPAVPVLFGRPSVQVWLVAAGVFALVAVRWRSALAGAAAAFSMYATIRSLGASTTAMTYGSPDGWVSETGAITWLNVGSSLLLVGAAVITCAVGYPKAVALYQQAKVRVAATDKGRQPARR